MSYFHKPVLLEEVIDRANPKPGENIIDGTVGGSSHAMEFLKRTSPNGKLLGIDLDNEALLESKRKLKEYSERIILEKGNFSNFLEFTKKHNFYPINIFFLDLGISSNQLDNDKMGISFLKNSPLDMRIGSNKDGEDNRTIAEHIINNWNENDIRSILKDYGEEKYANFIAKKIVNERKEKRIIRTWQLVEIISKAVPQKYKKQKIHFATRTFQALRIAVNRELESLENALPQILNSIESGGRICVISFHSLEDRIVKRFFQKESKECICDLKIPVCVCKHKKRLEILTRKPVMASEREITLNPRSRSAKLRIAKKI